MPLALKVAIIKPKLIRSTHDPDALANNRRVNDLLFISKILGKAVA